MRRIPLVRFRLGSFMIAVAVIAVALAYTSARLRPMTMRRAVRLAVSRMEKNQKPLVDRLGPGYVVSTGFDRDLGQWNVYLSSSRNDLQYKIAVDEEENLFVSIGRRRK